MTARGSRIDDRTPIHEGPPIDTSWCTLVLENETGLDAPKEQRESLAKGKAWLSRMKPTVTHQEKVFTAILAMCFWQVPRGNQPQIDELFALQQPDGGWHQRRRNDERCLCDRTDSVCSFARRFTAERPAIKRAIDFLVATQKPDGSSPMTSRVRSRRREGVREAVDADHLCRRFLGDDRLGEVRAKGKDHRRAQVVDPPEPLPESHPFFATESAYRIPIRFAGMESAAARRVKNACRPCTGIPTFSDSGRRCSFDVSVDVTNGT